jgi:hypothetical protein
MVGSLARAPWTMFEQKYTSFFIYNVFTSEKFNLCPRRERLETFGALLSITFSLSHPATLRQLSRCRAQGIFRQISSAQHSSSSCSKARELQRSHFNSSHVMFFLRSSHVMFTCDRCSLVRLPKGPSSTVGWRAAKRSLRGCLVPGVKNFGVSH